MRLVSAMELKLGATRAGHSSITALACTTTRLAAINALLLGVTLFDTSTTRTGQRGYVRTSPGSRAHEDVLGATDRSLSHLILSRLCEHVYELLVLRTRPNPSDLPATRACLGR